MIGLRHLSLCVWMAANVVFLGANLNGELVVEEVGPSIGPAEVDLRVDDRLESWRRGAQSGDLGSPFDFERMLIEELPRGSVRLLGRRASRPFELLLGAGVPKITLRPWLAPQELERYREGDRLIAEVALGEGIDPWRALAQNLERDGNPRGAAWLWRRIARTHDRESQRDEARAALESAIRIARAALTPRFSDVLALEEELADLLGRHGEVAEAERRHREVLDRRGGPETEHLAVARSLAKLAFLVRERSELAVAEELYLRSLEIRQNLAPESLAMAEGLKNLGIIADRQGRLDRAEGLYLRAFEICQRLAPRGPDAMGSVNNLGGIAFKRGDYQRAEEFLDKARSIREWLDPDSPNVAPALNNLAVIAERRGELARAEELMARVLAIRERSAPGSGGVAAALNNLGVLSQHRGDLEMAETLLRRALEIKRRIDPEGLSVARSLLSIGSLFAERGELDAAAESYRQAAAIEAKLAPGSLRLADIRIALGHLALSRGDLDKAELLLQDAAKVAEERAPDGHEFAIALHNLGEVARDRGDLAAAEDFLQRALSNKQRRAPGGSLSIVISLRTLGEVALERGAVELAQRRLERALDLATQLAPGSLEEAESSAALATVQLRAGRHTEATELRRRAVEALEAQSRRLGGSHDLRSRFAASYAHIYGDYLRLLLAEGRHQLAFDLLERYRARVLLAMLAERDLTFAGDLPAELSRERLHANANYDRVYQRLAGADTASSEHHRARRELTAARRRQDEIAATIRAINPRLAALTDPRPLDLGAVRRVLDRGTLLMSYVVSGDDVFLFTVGPGPDDFAVHRLDATAATLAREIDQLRRVVETLVDEGALAVPLSRLSATLLGPAAAAIERAKRLLVLPDDALHFLPFAALPDPTSDDVRPLIARRPVTITSSATVFAQLKADRRQESSPKLVAFGDPDYGDHASAPIRSSAFARRLSSLPATRTEVEQLADLFAGSRVHLGAAATEERVKALEAGVSILHLAGHGLVDFEQPLDSGLLLSLPKPGASGENGLLQGWEIFEQLRIKARLVTLSACGSGLGATRGGEGLVGLTRAFHYAGARSVLASLWSISDLSTAELMRRFYGHLAAGESLDEALRRAQLELSSGPIETATGEVLDASHPFYWAGFQLFGDWF